MPKLRLSPIVLVMNIALVVYGLTALLSLDTAYDSSLSKATIAAVIGSVILYFFVVNLLWRLDAVPLFAKLLGGVGLIFSLFFISQFGHQNYIETPGMIDRAGSLTTFLPNLHVFIHQNSAATFIELLLPIVFTLILMTTNGIKRLFWSLTLLVLIYAFVLTYSRGGFVGLAAAFLLGLGVVGAKRLSGKQAVLLIVGIVIVVSLFVAGLVILGPRVPFVASLMGVTSSRLEIYRNSLRLAGDYLFTGIGLGNTFAMVYSRYSLMIFVPLFTYTHNLFLAVLLGQGIIGLAAFLIALITFYLFAARVLWIVRITAIEPIFYGGLIGVTAAVVHGLVDARQYVESPFNLPLLFIGMALTVACGIGALRAETVQDQSTNRGGGWRTLAVITTGLIVLLVVGFVVFNKQVMAAWHTNLGALAETRADTFIQPDISDAVRADDNKTAREEYEQALQLDPNFPNANRRLGNLNVGEGAFKEAVPLLESAYALEPDYPASIKGLGLAYTWTGRTLEAACMFRKLPEVESMLDELYAWQNYRDGEQQELLSAYALETAAILEDYQQTNMDVWMLTGDRYRAAGKPEMAQQWYSRVLDKDPNNTDAADALTALGLQRVKVVSETECK